METLEELKAIIAGKPDGATHITQHRCVYLYKKCDGSFFWWDGDGWFNLDKPVCLRSLSDIERIIELMEWQVEANKNYQSMIEAYLND